jgi:Cu-processing system permease protein
MRTSAIVAINTVKEIIRDRVLYGLVVFAVLLVFVSLLLGGLSFDEQARIVTDLGLVAVQLGCGMLAVFVGSSLVYREIEKQTVLTLLSKPVSRSSFLLGKFMGLGIVIVLVDLLISGFLALVCVYFGAVHWNQFLVSSLGVLLESLFLLSVSLFFGVFCRPILTTIFTLSVWLVGHGISDMHFFSEKSQSPVLRQLGTILARSFPNLDYFNFKEAVVYGDIIAVGSIHRALILWFAWFLILLVTSIWIFEKRDFT